MCFACLHDPFDLIDFAKIVAKKNKSELEGLQQEAAIVKEEIKIIEERRERDGDASCTSGTEVIKKLRERQYEIARRL